MINDKTKMLENLFHLIVSMENELVTSLNTNISDENLLYDTLEITLDYDIFIEIEPYITDINNFKDINPSIINFNFYENGIYDNNNELDEYDDTVDIVYNLTL